jgi:ketosteroid isomerase-like protein
MPHSKAELVRGYFAAYESGDRKVIEDGFADDFTFTSPYDDVCLVRGCGRGMDIVAGLGRSRQSVCDGVSRSSLGRAVRAGSGAPRGR